MLLPLQRARRSKTAEIRTIVPLVAGQQCGCIRERPSPHRVYLKNRIRQGHLGKKVSRRIFKYVDIAKLLVKASESMQEQQSILLALSNANGILHECQRNPLMTKIWDCAGTHAGCH